MHGRQNIGLLRGLAVDEGGGWGRVTGDVTVLVAGWMEGVRMGIAPAVPGLASGPRKREPRDLIAGGSKSLGSRFRGNDCSWCCRGNGLLCSRGDHELSRSRANSDHQDRAAWND